VDREAIARAVVNLVNNALKYSAEEKFLGVKLYRDNGAVKLEVSGAPEVMGYCHCRSRRSWSGGPVNAFMLWKPAAVRVTAGAEHVGMYQKTPISERQYCKKCGGHLMANHPPLGLVDVFAATLPTLEFSPAVHVNYAETVLPMRDGLPKFKDFPAEFGGSGEHIAE